ncbi:Rieske (2Fe-2S) protein [Micromonospora endolithica]|uniref:Cytochrome bc1 complex Rieske iron-sulfur subunit n=1 Tax=Micromonospora endolithica TaxID=230091 RepID=A0A3A9ZHG7_9ACTN|nr:Rieske (2Fe-2S) protein [Micromonospora endolithica]RKN47851.1 Rieske (2Fe-2S) protein [Micromonospora endolithica]TWJ21545.1 nitrite reductase/ring-hydroxylating ferredoxin subunit [Micromonospora endolithica]
MSDDPRTGRPCRRAVLAGSGAVGVTALLAGCQTYGAASAPAPAAPPPAAGGAPGDASAPADGETAALARVADVPVGGGRILADQGIVLTQPAAGTIKAFSARCTHQGCTVTSVDDGTIVCACHNSVFDIADGSVRGGPAKQPLPETPVAVDGDTIRLA